MLTSAAKLDGALIAIAEYEQQGAVLARLLAELNASGEWAEDGATSMASWMVHHRIGMSHREASSLLKLGKFLNRFSAVGEAAVSGQLTASQIAALQAAVRPAFRDLFDEHQHAVVDAITGLDARATEQVCNAWREKAEAIVDPPEPKLAERSWSTATLEDGTTVGRFVLDPAGAAELQAALRTATGFDGADDVRTSKVRNADAIVSILAFFNANHHSNATRRHYPHVELHIEHDPEQAPFDGYATTPEHTVIPQGSKDAYLCDCVIHRVTRAGNAILDYGRGTHTVPAPLWKAVAARDRGCRFPSCSRPTSWCDAHHIRWWRKHGETRLDNLLMLCSHHHHLVHRHCWQIVLHPDSIVTFTTPDGRTLTSKPPGKPNIRAPIAA
jgi:hypothetical protein